MDGSGPLPGALSWPPRSVPGSSREPDFSGQDAFHLWAPRADTDRPYRKALPVEHALDEIVNNAGMQFDPVCAALLVEVIERLGDADLEDRFVRYA